MKNIIIISALIFSSMTVFCDDLKYPFLYIPGMFDNGDLLTADSLLVRNLNDPDGFYFHEYFSGGFKYDREPIQCSSSIVGVKYNRLAVANVIGEYRTNISIRLMALRLFCLLNGRAPKNMDFRTLTNFKGCDLSGTVVRDGREIRFDGLIEELWVKYGKIVHYSGSNGKFNVSYDDKGDLFYINPDGYFDSCKDINFNVVAHSSGGLAIREFMRLQSKEGLFIPVNSIINLSVPQKGARLVVNLDNNFPKLIRAGIDSFYGNIGSGKIEIKTGTGTTTYTYRDLESRTRIDLLEKSDFVTDIFVDILSAYILYFVPFDGKKRVLGTDPALYDLNPKHGFVKRLNKTAIPSNIKIYNFRVRSPYAKIFELLAACSGLGESDGVVDFLDTGLDGIPGSGNLVISDTIVNNANHIPMPYIKPIFELRGTIEKNYAVLKLLLKSDNGREQNVDTISVLFLTIFNEMDFIPEDFMKNKNYSVIDYFAENPVAL
jgi:hypothetical protein